MKDNNDPVEPGKAADKAVGGAKGPDELRRQIQETRGNSATPSRSWRPRPT